MQPDNLQRINATERYFHGQDPIETNRSDFDDTELAQHARSDIGRIDRILQDDPSLTSQERHELYLMGCNRRLEWLYADHGGKALPLGQFSAEISKANDFFIRAGKDAQANSGRHPQQLWDVVIKHQDLYALNVYRNAQESQTTLRGTERGRQMAAATDNQMYTLLRKSLNFMYDLQQYAERPGVLGEDARGKLNEVLLITYARMKTYEDQSYGELFVRSALDREDAPWNGYKYPKRNVDIVIEGKYRKRLLQAKNYDNRDQYAYPIEKIVDTNYRATQENLDVYVGDMRLLIDNSSDPRMRDRLNASARRLDGVFGVRLGDLQPAGR